MKNKLLYILVCIFCFIGCTDETKVQSVRLEPTELTLNIGETYQIEMIINPISAIIYNPVAWRSSDPNVAQVDSKGNVTAIYAGECIITCKTKHHEDYCRVTVVAPKYEVTFTNCVVFDEDNENILKSIAEKFHAEYYEECNITDSDNNLKISFQ